MPHTAAGSITESLKPPIGNMSEFGSIISLSAVRTMCLYGETLGSEHMVTLKHEGGLD